MNWLAPEEVKAWLEETEHTCADFTCHREKRRHCYAALDEALEQFVRALAQDNWSTVEFVEDRHFANVEVARLLVKAMEGK